MENTLNIQLTVDDEQLAQLIRGNISVLNKQIDNILNTINSER